MSPSWCALDRLRLHCAIVYEAKQAQCHPLV